MIWLACALWGTAVISALSVLESLSDEENPLAAIWIIVTIWLVAAGFAVL